MDEPSSRDRAAARGIALAILSGVILWALIGFALSVLLGPG